MQPLTGLRVAPYYGCQVVRPMNGFDSTEYPMKMDELFTWLGAEVVDYPVKAHCCGGHMTQISEDAAFELIRRLLDSAVEYEADLILCMCPMCQLNLDAYQGRVASYFNRDFQMPIIFFTQLLGVALGIDFEKLGIGKEIVAAGPVIKAKLAAAPARDAVLRCGLRGRPGLTDRTIISPHCCEREDDDGRENRRLRMSLWQQHRWQS